MDNLEMKCIRKTHGEKVWKILPVLKSPTEKVEQKDVCMNLYYAYANIFSLYYGPDICENFSFDEK